MQTLQHPTKELLTTSEAASYLSITASTLINWRHTKRVEVPFVRIGHAVRYRRSDLDAFLAQSREEG